MLAFKSEIDEVRSIEIKPYEDDLVSDDDSATFSDTDSNIFIKTCPYNEKIGDLSDSKILSYIEPVKVVKSIFSSTKLPNKIPVAEVRTTSGDLADVMASCNKQAYGKPVEDERTDTSEIHTMKLCSHF
jgi:hypothetical protein